MFYICVIYLLSCCKERIFVLLKNHSQMGGRLDRMGFCRGQLGRMTYVQDTPSCKLPEPHSQEQCSALGSSLFLAATLELRF